MERASPLNGIALREVVRIGLLARGAEPYASNLWGLGVLLFFVGSHDSICSHLVKNSR
jgi:hypothetical protein